MLSLLAITIGGILPSTECLPPVNGVFIPEDKIIAIRVYEAFESDTTLLYEWENSLPPGSEFHFTIPARGAHLLAMKAVDDGGNESCEFSQWRWYQGADPPALDVPKYWNEVVQRIYDAQGRFVQTPKSAGVYFEVTVDKRGTTRVKRIVLVK